MPKIIKVGTRGSRLALIHTQIIINGLKDCFPGCEYRICEIKTEGDRKCNMPLGEISGRGVFVKDIETVLLNGRIDLAVHSVKDMPAWATEGLKISAIFKREDPRDVLLTPDKLTLKDLPKGPVIGTSSIRRSILARQLRSDIITKPIRGNVDTRIRKMQAGEYDGIIVAAAGIHRLGLKESISEYFPLDLFIPDAGQGALAVQTRENDWVSDIVKAINDVESQIAVETERSFLRAVNGSCSVPAAAYAEVKGHEVILSGLIAYDENKSILKGIKKGDIAHHEELGKTLAEEMSAKACAYKYK